MFNQYWEQILSASYQELSEIEDKIIFEDLKSVEYEELLAAITIRKIELKG